MDKYLEELESVFESEKETIQSLEPGSEARSKAVKDTLAICDAMTTIIEKERTFSAKCEQDAIKYREALEERKQRRIDNVHKCVTSSLAVGSFILAIYDKIDRRAITNAVLKFEETGCFRSIVSKSIFSSIFKK